MSAERRVGLRHEVEPVAGATRVRAQIFPLLATMARLQQLCDEVFNDHVPDTIAIFRPALPLVFCGVLDYPDMGDALPLQTGSLSQKELYFLVPLERYRRVGARVEFVELGCTTPYIFVDNAESVASARERFGMGKELARFSTDWQDLPWSIGTQRYLKLQGYEPSFDGHRLVPLLEILEAERVPLAFGARDNDLPRPETPFSNPLDWLTALLEASSLLGSSTPDSVLARLRSYLDLLRLTQSLNLFSLRQFPDPENPEYASYQDLIAFRMRVADIQTAGLLEPLSQFELRIRKTEQRPMVKRLGLRVAQRTSACDDGEREQFESVSAVCPVFGQCDVDLLNAERVAWKYSRGDATTWFDDDNVPHGPATRPKFNTYLTTNDAAFLDPQGAIPTLDLKFLLLPARRERLEELVKTSIPVESRDFVRVSLLAHGEYSGVRFLFSKSRPRQKDEARTLLWSDGDYLSISIPVEVETRTGKFRANYFLQDFSNNPFMVIAMRAMLGEPTTQAHFEPGEGGWFTTSRSVATLLSLSALALERTGSTANVEQRPLLDVLAADGADPAAGLLASGDLQALSDTLWPHAFQILPGLAVGHVPWAHRPDRSIFDRVMVMRYAGLDTFQRREPLARRRHAIRFHDSLSFPLCEQLGLVALSKDSPFVERFEDDGTRGHTATVPVIGYGEAVSQVRVDEFQILCETTALSTRSTP